ncbi:ComF family protein [Pedobacter sandarakinus]|uniref:ComF family protein n=1 Tax=Pedobacter sandarakinus TaxID=353156 RepID=UPI0022451DDD|nr:ComF family protein [Pedobacter sandarakinus]MCX2574037.1 ComF family protein [Pedobacter sandarakinus]
MLITNRWINDLIGLLFPEVCYSCGVGLFRGEKMVCTKCLYDLPFTDYHKYKENRVAKQLWGRLPVNAAMAMLYFRKGGKVQTLIHRLKYHNKTEIGVFLGNMLGEKLKEAPLYGDIDIIIPVPLHRKKLKLRGYNQSAFIASGIAEQLGVGFRDDVLVRVTSTESQTKKSRFSRYENMLLVFKVEIEAEILNRHVLIVDDVITTGATLEACASVLLAKGAAKVSIAALAFAE